MATKDFFKKPAEQSKVKISIVSKYFSAWANIINSSPNVQKINYIDLFSGPGKYDDGTPSVPLLVLETAIKNTKLHNKLVSIFNDKIKKHYKKLKTNIFSLQGIEKLKYKPQIFNEVVSEEFAKQFSEARLNPTLSFLDPWGYKGLSLELIDSLIKDWGSDCIFFFNFSRVNSALSNPKLEHRMDEFFSKDKARKLRNELTDIKGSGNRERRIVEELGEALRERKGQHVLEFSFRDNKGKRVIHHLIFVSKNPKGFEVIKDIMARESSNEEQGVATFEYNPQQILKLNKPLDKLQQMLLKDFTGQELSKFEIFHQHNIKPPYIYTKKNYSDALTILMKNGNIEAHKPDGKPIRKGTFPDDVIVTFPN